MYIRMISLSSPSISITDQWDIPQSIQHPRLHPKIVYFWDLGHRNSLHFSFLSKYKHPNNHDQSPWSIYRYTSTPGHLEAKCIVFNLKPLTLLYTTNYPTFVKLKASPLITTLYNESYSTLELMFGSKSSQWDFVCHVWMHLPLLPHICVSESGQHWFR